jgi:hypothetical protein
MTPRRRREASNTAKPRIIARIWAAIKRVLHSVVIHLLPLIWKAPKRCCKFLDEHNGGVTALATIAIAF